MTLLYSYKYKYSEKKHEKRKILPFNVVASEARKKKKQIRKVY
jgi:hypothetical protein